MARLLLREVNRQPVTVEQLFQSQSICVEFVVDKVEFARFHSKYFDFLSSILFRRRSHWERDVGWECLRIGCWGEYSGLKGTR